MKKLILGLLLIISSNLFAQFTVINVRDGDSFQVYEETSGQVLEVRLAYVDAPEMGMYHYEESKEYLKKLLLNKKILLDIISFDMYRRVIGQITVDNLNINMEVLKSGNCYVYTKYCTDKKYYEAEFVAKYHTIGIWRGKSKVRPWEFRKVKTYRG